MSVTEAPLGGNVGSALRRKEDPRLITGRAPYVDDISLPGMLWAAIVRSPEAHAKVVSIDTSAATARDGITAVFTGEDMSDLGGPLPMAWAPPGVEVNNPEHWPLVRGVVKHVGDPVAVVIGDDRYAVIDAAEDVIVEYETLPAIIDPEAAIAGAPFVHEQFGTNQVHQWTLAGGRRRGRLRRGRRDRRAARGQPPDRGRADRVPRRDRRLPRRLADAAHVDPGPALRAPVHGAAARHDRGSRPRDRARGRRRLRPEAAGLRRGAAGLLGVTQAGPSR